MEALPIAATALLALLSCGLYLRFAGRWQIMDTPNARSAHSTPVPRGGGVGIFVAIVAGFVLLTWWQQYPAIYGWLLSLSMLLVVVGALDDRRGLPVGVRLALYGVVCAAAVWLLLWPLAWWLAVLAALYVLWMLNLFNFMDGIDGLAASQTLFVAGSAALLSFCHSGNVAYTWFCLLPAAASLGFLYWNWSPARLFMGDAGSIPLGFLLAALSLLGAVTGALPLSCWLILLAVFITDATATVSWRALSGQPVTQAHNQHLYQRLARRWGVHTRVVWALQACNVLWLLPMAVASLVWPEQAGWALLAAYLPLALAWLKAVILPCQASA